MAKQQINLEQAFSGALQAKEIPSLQQEIDRLKTQLELAYQQQGIIDVPLDQIQRNPKQPRSSFYVVQQLKASLEREGQKEPILLVCPHGQPACPPQFDGYLIFDGECRWQAAQLLGWSTIKAIVIPYNESTFDEDVFIAAVSKSGLNALDLAQSLLERIQVKSSHLPVERIPTMLNTIVMRLKRQGKQKALGALLKQERDWQQKLSELGLSADEQEICLTIFNYGLNPVSVNQNNFPMLKLSEDIKQAIRERGLKNAQARGIGKIDAAKLSIAEERAQQLRQEVIEVVLKEELSRTQTNKLIEQKLSQWQTKSDSPQVSLKVKRCLSSVKTLSTNELNPWERERAIATLEQCLSQLRQGLAARSHGADQQN